MTREELILDLDARFSKMYRSKRGVTMIAYIRDKDESIKGIKINYVDWAKCRSRFDRWNLLRERI